MAEQEPLSWLAGDQIYTHRQAEGLSGMKLLALPEGLRRLVNEVLRQEPAQADELAQALGRDRETVEQELALLVAQGWLERLSTPDGPRYQVRLGRRRRRSLPPGIWQTLEGVWRLPLFRAFSETERADFASAFRQRSLQTGEVLFEEGTWGDTLYLVDSGEIELVTTDIEGRSVVLRRLRAGDVVGEAAVLIGERHPFTARAIEPSQVWTLRREDLARLLAQDPSTALLLERELSGRGGTTPADSPPALNPVLFVGPGIVEFLQVVTHYTRCPITLLDLRRVSPTIANLLGKQVAYRSAWRMDGKSLSQAIQEALKAGRWTFVAAPPTDQPSSALMGVISLMELMIDLSGKSLPWAIAAARRRWVIPAEPRVNLDRLARQLVGRTVGLVFSGGMARALAHIGVLRALLQAGVPVDGVTGTGLGAVIAALYAAGFSPDEIAHRVRRAPQELSPFDGGRNLRLANRAGLYAGRRARIALQRWLGDRSFEDLTIPFRLPATDLRRGQTTVLEEGPLAQALEVALALPGLVVPVERDGVWLVDGWLHNPLPAHLLRQQGIGLIIGINTLSGPPSEPQETSLDLTRTWLEIQTRLAHAAMLRHLSDLDFLITVPLDNVAETDFDRAEEIITRGEEAAERQIEILRDLLRLEW